ISRLTADSVEGAHCVSLFNAANAPVIAAFAFSGLRWHLGKVPVGGLCIHVVELAVGNRGNCLCVNAGGLRWAWLGESMLTVMSSLTACVTGLSDGAF